MNDYVLAKHAEGIGNKKLRRMQKTIYPTEIKLFKNKHMELFIKTAWIFLAIAEYKLRCFLD